MAARKKKEPDPIDEPVEPPERRTRVEDLRSDYDRLGILLGYATGSQAAALVRERRIVGELLEAIETPKVVPVVDQLAAKREALATNSGSASRRRKSG